MQEKFSVRVPCSDAVELKFFLFALRSSCESFVKIDTGKCAVKRARPYSGTQKGVTCAGTAIK